MILISFKNEFLESNSEISYSDIAKKIHSNFIHFLNDKKCVFTTILS